jgi:SAM-dependent methyltransferase
MSGPATFDRALYLRRVERWRRKRPDALGHALAMEVAERLSLINRRFDEALLIAHDHASVERAIASTGRVARLIAVAPQVSEDLGLDPHSLNAIIHLIDLSCVNDVPGVLVQMARALKPDGLLLCALFAGESLTELRQAWLQAEAHLTGGVSPRVSPMLDLRQLGGLLQRAGLALPVVDSDRLTVRYDSGLALMRDIRNCGLSNMLADRSRKPVPRGLMAEAAVIYQDRFSDGDGRIRATVELAWATAWSPHASQQQPLRPGSAKARLADALKVAETKLKP